MNGIAVLQANLTDTAKLFQWYVADLTDADLLVRPVPEANHAAWQWGHVIVGEQILVLTQLPETSMPPLPEGFAAAHDTAAATKEVGFFTKDEYAALFAANRVATIAALGSLTDADLDRPTQGPMASFAPRLGDFFNMLAQHDLMHAAQFTVVRRKLGKPVLF
ncbi:MAG: DinB family protein [Planctomycetia bacterium]